MKLLTTVFVFTSAIQAFTLIRPQHGYGSIPVNNWRSSNPYLNLNIKPSNIRYIRPRSLKEAIDRIDAGAEHLVRRLNPQTYDKVCAESCLPELDNFDGVLQDFIDNIKDHVEKSNFPPTSTQNHRPERPFNPHFQQQQPSQGGWANPSNNQPSVYKPYYSPNYFYQIPVPGEGNNGQPGTPGGNNENPETPESNNGQPGTPGGNSGNPGTPGSNNGQPGTPGGNNGNPGISGSNSGQPGTPGNNIGQPGTLGEGNNGNPGTSGEGNNGQPGTPGEGNNGQPAEGNNGQPGIPGSNNGQPGTPGNNSGQPGTPGTNNGQPGTPGSNNGQPGIGFFKKSIFHHRGLAE